MLAFGEGLVQPDWEAALYRPGIAFKLQAFMREIGFGDERLFLAVGCVFFSSILCIMKQSQPTL
ncbi:uncharacterized protein N7479_011457 [Penicillium vulpinum]|uniref:uncharacterized protein n=1 Tax=Penicillium vulpinum TaxID=29845 RepID=UPI00254943EC|nr:uncharacterized protein N7479_011457 [Penicillium vulpinum]KAJ5953044.1 hypothetical protein N7479_011457 [Penicillium vulpinum]